jgi:hypothetical protein
MVDYQGKFVTKDAVPGQINLLTSGDGVSFASVPVITGNQTITMDVQFDTSTSGITLWFRTMNVNDYLLLVIGSVAETSQFGLTVQVASGGGEGTRFRRYYNINSYINQIVNLEIIKTTGSITSVKMNTNTLSPTTGFFDPSNITMKEFSGVNNFSLWNLEIAGNHKWIGYPYGNTNGAWADTIGTNHGTITGTPGTRNLI